MSKTITQRAEENKQISERIKNYMKRFDVASALKSSNAFKIKVFRNEFEALTPEYEIKD